MRAQTDSCRRRPCCALCDAPGQAAAPELDGNVDGVPYLRLQPRHRAVMRGANPVYLRSQSSKGIVVGVARLCSRPYGDLNAKKVLKDLVDSLLGENRVAARCILNRRPFKLCTVPLYSVPHSLNDGNNARVRLARRRDVENVPSLAEASVHVNGRGWGNSVPVCPALTVELQRENLRAREGAL